MTTSDTAITIRRAELAPAVDRLAQRLGGVSSGQVEAALWQWLQQATEALVSDGDAYAGREAHGFLPRVFRDALAQQGGQ